MKFLYITKTTQFKSLFLQKNYSTEAESNWINQRMEESILLPSKTINNLETRPLNHRSSHLCPMIFKCSFRMNTKFLIVIYVYMLGTLQKYNFRVLKIFAAKEGVIFTVWLMWIEFGSFPFEMKRILFHVDLDWRGKSIDVLPRAYDMSNVGHM